MITRLLTLILMGMSICYGAESTNQFPNASKFPNDEAAYNYANPKIIWGAPTNFLSEDFSGKFVLTSLRSGINVSNGVIVLSGKPLKNISSARLLLENLAETNWVVNIFMPPANERVEFAMTDTNGTPIPKTALGLTVGQSSTLKPKTGWRRFAGNNYTRLGLSPKGVDEISFLDLIDSHLPFTPENMTDMWELNPARYFVLEKPGLYKLTVTQCLYIADTNTYLKFITLPPVTVDVKVEKDAKQQ